MKKFLSLFCAIALTLSLAVPAVAVSPNAYENKPYAIPIEDVTAEMRSARAALLSEYPGLEVVSPDSLNTNDEVLYVEDLSKVMPCLNSAPLYRNGYDVSEFVDNYLESLTGWEDSNSSTILASSAYGDAPAYHQENSTTINCYGYAADFNWWINPGDIYYTYGSQFTDGSTVDDVAYWVQQDFHRAGGRPIREISSATSSINSTERRIVTQVGEHNVYDAATGTTFHITDYHFMRQTNTGRWAHKPGGTPSMNTSITNPSFAWDLYGTTSSGNVVVVVAGFYDSGTIYLAI